MLNRDLVKIYLENSNEADTFLQFSPSFSAKRAKAIGNAVRQVISLDKQPPFGHGLPAIRQILIQYSLSKSEPI